MRRHIPVSLVGTALAMTVALLPVTPAAAAPADKGAVLARWTRSGATSYDAFFAARADQGAWSAYGFDWSTDYCTSSPDNPLGFPFRNACARHDFGYRNYKAAGSFGANKSRLDDAFYGDLKRVCATYSGVKKATCDATAWTYYQAVDKLGRGRSERRS
ncbi:phospholipase [Streptomyces sp. NPDC056358]|uniref:phospholipase n=1 Tax=Streptomyces sp. NPDC056358 TaxID=3345794 RepID=UPI0035D90351